MGHDELLDEYTAGIEEQLRPYLKELTKEGK